MVDLGALKAKITIDKQQAEKDVKSFQQTMNEAGKKMQDIGGKLTTAVTLPIIGIGTAAVKTASDISENLNKMNATFNESADVVEAWSDTSAKEFGIAKNDFLDYVSVYGALSQDILKMTEEQSAEFSKQIIQRSADISSYYNLSLEESNSLMQQLYSGETEGWKRLGITINDTTLQEYAHAEGIQKTVADMTLQEKTMLRIQYAMDKTARAEGDFAKTSDGLANSSRVLKAQIEDLGGNLGQVLLPTVEKVTQGITNVISGINEFITKNPEAANQIVMMLGILAAVGPTLLGVGKAIQLCTSLGATMGAVFSPVTLIIVGVIAAVAALALAWQQNLGGIRDSTAEAFQTIQNTFSENSEQIKQIFNEAWQFIQQVWVEVGTPIFELIGEAVKTASDIFAWGFPLILQYVQLCFDKIQFIYNTIFKPVFDFIMDIIRHLLELVQDHMPQIQQLFEGAFGIMDKLWNNIMKPAFEGLAAIVGWVYEQIKPALDLIREAFDFCFGWIIDLLNGAIGLLNDFLSLFDSAEEKSSNSSIGAGSGTSASQRSVQVMPFAKGGILTRATIFGMAGRTALLGGEAGAEAVIPLSRLPELVAQMGTKGTGNITVINNSPKALTERESARQFKRAMKELAFTN